MLRQQQQIYVVGCLTELDSDTCVVPVQNFEYKFIISWLSDSLKLCCIYCKYQHFNDAVL